MNKPKILHKIHENYNCNNFHLVVKYLYANGVDIRPEIIFEKNFPENIKIFPTIFIENEYIEGLENILEYYEKKLNFDKLLFKATLFSINNPYYQISDKATHKKLIL